MDIKKPQNVSEYITWLKNTHNISITDRTENQYLSVANKIYLDFQNSNLWTDLSGHLNNFDEEYYLKTHYYLFADKEPPKLQIKPFSSLLDKCYRKNVVHNPNWPNEPHGGWILPQNWYYSINDIIRTCFVVKYLDGVEFFGNCIQSTCEKYNHKCTIDFEAKEEGYYAAHTYITFTCDIPKENWDTSTINVSIELQITTQLQEVIRKLLHKYYEERRKAMNTAELKWQWNYKSDEFATNYLGHILHYVEGMIMDVRNRQKEK